MEKRQKGSGPRLLNNFFLNSIEKAATVQSHDEKISSLPLPSSVIIFPRFGLPCSCFYKMPP